MIFTTCGGVGKKVPASSNAIFGAWLIMSVFYNVSFFSRIFTMEAYLYMTVSIDLNEI